MGSLRSSWMVLLFVGIVFYNGLCWAQCIPGNNQGGSEVLIHNALSSGRNAVLCKNAVFKLTRTLILNHINQQILTEGLPVGTQRAMIRVSAGSLATAIRSHVSGTKIRSLQFDGGRESLGYLAPTAGGSALISIGGNVSGQVVEQVKAYHPRGWSVLHVFEGARACTQATIVNNSLGPAGYGNSTWADGISISCRNSLVKNNQITDVTDGGIVIFGSPGTIITGNVITSKSRTLLGGINLVDYQQFDGDNSGVVVSNNRIISAGALIKVGIAVGPRVWVPDWTAFNRNGMVLNNSIEGNQINYAIAVDGVTGYSITGNRNTSNAQFVRSQDDSRVDNSNLQCEFLEGDVKYAIDVVRPIVRSHRNTVRQAFCMMFNRVPDSSGMVTYTDALNSNLSKDDLMRILYRSDEFQNRTKAHQISNAEFVRLVYRVTLRREAEPAGYEAWLNLVNSGSYSREQIFILFTNSSESKIRFPYLY